MNNNHSMKRYRRVAHRHSLMTASAARVTVAGVGEPNMSDPFTIRIFVPDGNPEGVRIIDRMNWTGIGLAFPRAKWLEIKQRPEFVRTTG